MQETITNTDESFINELNERAWKLNRRDAFQAIELSSESLEKSKLINYQNGIAHALKTLGTACIWISENDKAASHLFEAIALFNQLGDKQNQAETNYYVGANFNYVSDFDAAIKFYNECYRLNSELKNEIGMADGLNGLGTVYYSIHKNEEALKVLLESEKLCLKHQNKEIYVKVMDGLGETYHNLGNYEAAMTYYIKCEELCRSIGNKQVAAFALDGLGRTYSAINNFKQAESNFNESLKLRRDLGFKSGEIITLFNLAVMFLKKNDFDKGIEFLEESLRLAQSINSKKGIYKAYEKLAEIYESKNQLDKALNYFKLYQKTRDEVRIEKTNQVVKSVELQQKVIQSQSEKLLLEEKAKELQSYSNNLVLISEIGQQIIAHHSISDIVETVYDHVNRLMDAEGFGIGLFSEKLQQVIFPLFIENGEKYENVSYSIENTERLAVNCYLNSKELVIHDFEKEIDKYYSTKATPLYGKRAASIIYLPLKVRGKTLGVISVQSFKANVYKEYHLNILRNLAAFAAIALDNAQLYELQERIIHTRTKEVLLQKEEIERAYQSSKLLSEIGQEITSSLNFEDIFMKLYNYLKQVMDADCFGVDIYRPELNEIEYKFSIESGIKSDEIFNISMDSDNNYSVWCIKNKKEVFINDLQVEYKKYVNHINIVVGKMPESIIYYPILIGEKVLGAVTIQSFRKHAYNTHHLNILKTLASYIAIALENASLYENMEEKVKQRTKEVVLQKEEIEKTHNNTQLLGQIGKDITSTLSVIEVIEKVYKNINSLMDASVFGIGIHNLESNKLEFSGTMENGKRLADFAYDLNDDTLSVWCFVNDEKIFINDFETEHSKYIKRAYKSTYGDDTRSMLFIPIYGKNSKLGIISVQSFNKNAYSIYHLDILQNLAVHIGIALDNASLYRHMEQRVHERTKDLEKNYNDTLLLSQIAEDVSSSLSVETIISKVYANISKLFKADCFGIGIYDSKQGKINFDGFVENGKLMEAYFYPISDRNRLAVICFQDKKEIFINDYEKEFSNYIKGIQAPISGKNSSSIIYLPIYSKNNIIGVITVQSYESNAYSSYHLNMLKSLAISIGIALDNANLYQNLEEKVNERTEEVNAQKEIIEIKNKDITDSIRYAKKIQQALMPDTDLLNEMFSQSFVYYLPKDIVSGDFYWIEKFGEDVIVFAAADCTGHGVPGAFMSLICNDLMNQIIKDQQVTSPGYALTVLDNRLRLMLNKSSDYSSNDGMDIALCAYHRKTKILQYAGAHRPLIIIRNGEIIEYKPSKFSIGGYLTANKEFIDNEIHLQEGDQVFVLTDGFSDQFGGEKGKKFKFKKLKDLLLSISNNSHQEQMKLLNEAFMLWKGKEEQVDDVCVIGIKI